MPHHHLLLLLHLTHLIFTAFLLEHIHIVEDKNNHLIQTYTIVVRQIISNSGCSYEAVSVRVSWSTQQHFPNPHHHKPTQPPSQRPLQTHPATTTTNPAIHSPSKQAPARGSRFLSPINSSTSQQKIPPLLLEHHHLNPARVAATRVEPDPFCCF